MLDRAILVNLKKKSFYELLRKNRQISCSFNNLEVFAIMLVECGADKGSSFINNDMRLVCFTRQRDKQISRTTGTYLRLVFPAPAR
ncbi:hypothetical protein KCP74_10635 [Salmonella enterica subsp. enterica]|nr:hypothetical protein KCP74_10635 [Salmonella enterica subsp. enterica]